MLGLGLLTQQAWQGYQALHYSQSCVLRPVPLLTSLALYIAAYFVQMAAWTLIMRSLQVTLPVRSVIEGYALSFLPRYIPGSVWGYLSRNEWLAQTHQVSYATSTIASILEAGMLLITAAILGGFYGLQLPQWQAIISPHIDHSFYLPIALAYVCMGLVGAWVVWQMLPRLFTRFTKKSLPKEDGSPVQHAYNKRGTNFQLWAITIALYLAFWFMQGGALMTIAQALCEDMSLSLLAASAAFAISWGIGFLIIFVPAGLGVREWTLSTFLVTFAALQPGHATLLALISRFGLIVAEIVVLGIGLHGQIRSRFQRKGRNDNDRN